MGNEFRTTKGDTFPSIFTTLSDDNGPVPLDGASVVFKMSQSGANNPIITGDAVVLDQSIISNIGRVRYDWGPSDTTRLGTFNVKWKVTFSNGQIASFPKGKNNFNKVIIEDDVT